MRGRAILASLMAVAMVLGTAVPAGQASPAGQANKIKIVSSLPMTGRGSRGTARPDDGRRPGPRRRDGSPKE